MLRWPQRAASGSGRSSETAVAVGCAAVGGGLVGRGGGGPPRWGGGQGGRWRGALARRLASRAGGLLVAGLAQAPWVVPLAHLPLPRPTVRRPAAGPGDKDSAGGGRVGSSRQ